MTKAETAVRSLAAEGPGVPARRQTASAIPTSERTGGSATGLPGRVDRVPGEDMSLASLSAAPASAVTASDGSSAQGIRGPAHHSAASRSARLVAEPGVAPASVEAAETILPGSHA